MREGWGGKKSSQVIQAYQVRLVPMSPPPPPSIEPVLDSPSLCARETLPVIRLQWALQG